MEAKTYLMIAFEILEKLDPAHSLEALAKEWGDEFWSISQIEASLKRENVFIMSACSAGVVEGLCFYELSLPSADILYVYVSLKMRGKGLGRALVERVVRDCQGKSASSLFLEVRVSNTKAIGLYQAVGFKEMGRRRHYYRDGEDALILRKNL